MTDTAAPLPTLCGMDVAEYVKTNGVDASVIQISSPTATVEEAAASHGVAVQQIIKCILFVVKGSDSLPTLVVACGTARVDSKKLAQHLGVPNSRVKLATPDEVLLHTGYPVGAVPPFGHRRALPTVVEESVMLQSEVYGGGGDLETQVRCSTLELVRATNAAVVALIKADS
eukprot:NODE_9231_length_654_cov_75.474576_g8965_i0.p1 GENE.NODE_9231_length_654_cov_75.474576_g8965_i0~~NODE_9231_length_654_cov_75.474576_g8965_i0.p1  ORF type:complete len:191 (+),score=39.38 NODE_9231_length_654_cov_75.474576_g8965_i0:59-574(+)